MPGTRFAGAGRELRAAGVLLAVVVVVSLVVGGLWGLLAPTERLLVVEPGRGAGLVGESLHRFDAMALFVAAGAVTGLLSAVAAWRHRRMRGPIQFAGLLLGSVAGAWVMSWAGHAVNHWNNPRPVDPPVGQIVALPVDLDGSIALLAQPFVASLVVLLLAGLSTTEDLGTGFMSPFGTSRRQPYADPEPESTPYQQVSPDPAPVGGMRPAAPGTGAAPDDGPPKRDSPAATPPG
ncbi:DUF2567 domain-containing protein [Nocardia sp. NPDC024068]|uniref:DUF2567 domain-containing protein n=1 Tax=Nocardia sp. NPDC024068 TaxID=3157197 RepID=UPI0033E622CC